MITKTVQAILLCMSLLISSCALQQLQVASGQSHPRALDLPPPTVTEAPNGELILENLGANASAKVTYPAIANGHKIRLRWTGKDTYYTLLQTVGATRPLVFTIPKLNIAADAGGTAMVTYSVVVGDNDLELSRPLPVRVINMPPSDGAAIAQAINTRYSDTRPGCSANMPAYYCNGVVIRGTDNGNFDPWNPSAGAIALGGTSFSYMRVDANVTPAHNSGFIFTPQEKAIADNKIVEYLCIYVHNASTSGNMRDKGCGLRPRSNIAADLSSCASINVRTLAQWSAHAATLPGAGYQCSLSTQDASQFQVSIQARANINFPYKTAWNEVMVATWAPDIGNRLPIEAFWWNTAKGSVAEAKAYQTKFKNKTGLWVPVIRVDVAQLNGRPFSYNAADQAVQP